MNIYVDGAGWNGRFSAYAIKFEHPVNSIGAIIKSVEGKKTNNEMEYTAVIAGAKLASEGDVIISDSQVVCNQIRGLLHPEADGIYRINKKHLKPLAEEAKRLILSKKISLKWVHGENEAGTLLKSLQRRRQY